MRILFIVSECEPFSKTGGLGDAAAALSEAFAALGHEVLVATPRYRGVDADDGTSSERLGFAFVDHPGYFDRSGLYGEGGRDYQDNDVRFAHFARASLAAAAERSFVPDLVHLHDWQAALAALYVKKEKLLPRAKVVLTIHNLAYQGLFPRAAVARAKLPRDAFTRRELEFHGRVSYLKGGLVHADALTTVSPRYAAEIQTPAFGFGLDGVFRERAAEGRLVGILNGADYTQWSPERDPHLPARYSAARLGGKARCKAALMTELGLQGVGDGPVLGVISRLDPQKGIDVVGDIAPDLVRLGARLAMLGSGDPGLERRLMDLAARHPGRIAVRIEFSEALAHQIQGGSDMLLVPSRWEPCGLTQMYALRYGTVPVVSAVGGLDDTVEDGVTGFKFEHHPHSQAALLQAVRSAVAMYRGHPTSWRTMMRTGMRRAFPWQDSALRHVALFEDLRSRRGRRAR